MKKLRVLVVSLLFVLVACDGGTSGTPDRPPNRSESASREPRSVPPKHCSNQAAAVADDSYKIGGELSGDIDGESDSDVVSLLFDESGEMGCQAFLEIDLGETSIVTPIWEIGPQGGLPRPRLHGLAQVDTDGGFEILVDEVAGASTQFVAVYTYNEGRVEQIEPEGVPDGLFPYGGSVGHIEAADCAAAGEIVVSEAVPGAGGSALRKGLYDITRRFYSTSGGGYVRDEVERHRGVPLDNLERFKEFASGPFGNCPIP